jgi:PAS domain S-box-containing protein
LSFRTSLLLTVVPLVAAATGVVAVVSHVYDRRVADRVTATVPRAEVMDLLREQRAWHLVLVLLLMALAAGVAIWLAGRVARPLRRLQAQAHAVAGGGPSAAIPEEGPAELRALAADFNRMAAAVAGREADLTKANAELARSQAVFRGLFDHTSDLVTLFRVPPEGPLVCEDANPATLAAAGIARGQAIGGTLYSNLPESEADWLEGRFREAATTGRPVAYERRIVLQGAERWFNTVVIPLPGPGGRPAHVATVSRDMTEQRKADRALQDSEAFLAELIESASDAIVAVDDQNTVLLFNAAAERAFGVPADQAFGRPVTRFLADGLCGQTGLRQVTARRADGSVFTADVSASALEAAGRQVCAATIRDVSARSGAEAELRSSERRFAQAFYASPAIMGITRLSDRTLVDVNDQWVRTMGVSREAAVGRTVADLGVRFDPAWADEMYRRLRAEASVRDVEFTAHTPRGRELRGLESASRIEVDGERCVLWSALDLTERLRAEEEARRLTAELERRVADRTAQLAAVNEELESFAYSVSHDLRAPLRVIDGFAQALVEDYGDRLDDGGRDFLDRIRTGSQQMGELIDDLLALSRAARGELRPARVDLSELAGRVVEALRTRDPARAVEVVIPPGVTATGDPSLLRVVLDNLLGNAWKYTGRTAHPRIEFGAAERDGERAYFVRDNGAGYDPAYAGKLFEPFQRLHRPDEFEGHGIGLATVRRVVNRHGGRAWADGQVGKGATVYFTLGTDVGGV